MNGKRAKLIRKVAYYTGATVAPGKPGHYKRLKRAWKAMNHLQRGKMRSHYNRVLRLATERGIL